jgi:hypothetical protein
MTIATTQSIVAFTLSSGCKVLPIISTFYVAVERDYGMFSGAVAHSEEAAQEWLDGKSDGVHSLVEGVSSADEFAKQFKAELRGSGGQYKAKAAYIAKRSLSAVA